MKECYICKEKLTNQSHYLCTECYNKLIDRYNKNIHTINNETIEKIFITKAKSEYHIPKLKDSITWREDYIYYLFIILNSNAEIINYFLEMKINQEKKEIEKSENDYRKKHKAEYRCNDGHYVRSKLERDIDNFLYNEKIRHEYEKEEYDPTTKENYFIDFYLPDYECYIEHYGLNDEKYNDKKKRKELFFKRNNLKVIKTTEKDSKTINDKLIKEIKDIKTKK